MPNPPDICNKKQLRKHLRQTRRALSQTYQKNASKRIVKTLKRLPNYHFAKRVALYLEADGEMPTQAIIADLRLRRRAVFVPLIDPMRPHHLRFVQLNPDCSLKTNRFGLLQPAFNYKKFAPAFSLSALLTPLVGFNEQAQRLGMGGGFYDRVLAKTNQVSPTFSVGLAYECQKCESLPQEPWDKALDYVATEQQLYPKN